MLRKLLFVVLGLGVPAWLASPSQGQVNLARSYQAAGEARKPRGCAPLGLYPLPETGQEEQSSDFPGVVGPFTRMADSAPRTTGHSGPTPAAGSASESTVGGASRCAVCRCAACECVECESMAPFP